MSKYSPEPGDYEAALGTWALIGLVALVLWFAFIGWLVLS
jgi:hypothetical protein